MENCLDKYSREKSFKMRLAYDKETSFVLIKCFKIPISSIST